jgi:hypothetical protein
MLNVVFGEPIGATLRRVRDCPAPVARSCHVGNNSNYNWGWLALARNTRFVMYDHTTYGADRVCFPWMVLLDHGVIGSAVDIDGNPIAELATRHVNATADRFPLRHRSLLNYGLPATVEGRSLTAHHHDANARLSRRVNGSSPSFDSREVVEHFALFSEIVLAFARARELHLLFDRWVQRRRSRVFFVRLGAIGYDGPDLRIDSAEGNALFRGSPAELLRCIHDSLREVVARIAHDRALGNVSYPWLTLPFSYLFGAAAEHAAHPGRDEFYHAGGLTSPYYMGEAAFKASFERLEARLGETGFLPARTRFNVIPIGCCQFFGRPASVGVLEELLDGWKARVRGDGSPEPRPDAVDAAARRWVYERTLAFNRADANRLPVCFDYSPPTPAFNKYGLATGALADYEIAFPEPLAALTWGEAECLVQTMGGLFAELPEHSDRPD